MCDFCRFGFANPFTSNDCFDLMLALKLRKRVRQMEALRIFEDRQYEIVRAKGEFYSRFVGVK